ncbi:MAG: COG2426 family protein [Armatimonadota bacterium]
MAERLFEALQGLPELLVVAILSAVPISEVRGGIPVGLLCYQLPLPLVLLVAIASNVLAVVPVLLCFNWVAEKLENKPVLGKLVSRLIHRARTKEAMVNKYGVWALALFVAIPLPITGAWTGATIAAVFGMNFWRAVFCMLVGVVVASAIVTGLCLGGVEIFNAIKVCP